MVLNFLNVHILDQRPSLPLTYTQILPRSCEYNKTFLAFDLLKYAPHARPFVHKALLGTSQLFFRAKKAFDLTSIFVGSHVKPRIKKDV